MRKKKKKTPNILIDLFFFSFLLFLTQIRRQKKKWERLELDGVTPHECNNKKKAVPTSTRRTVVGLDSESQIAALAEEVKG